MQGNGASGPQSIQSVIRARHFKVGEPAFLLTLSPTLPWHLKGGPSKRSLIFQVPSRRCHVSWREVPVHFRVGSDRVVHNTIRELDGPPLAGAQTQASRWLFVSTQAEIWPRCRVKPLFASSKATRICSDTPMCVCPSLGSTPRNVGFPFGFPVKPPRSESFQDQGQANRTTHFDHIDGVPKCQGKRTHTHASYIGRPPAGCLLLLPKLKQQAHVCRGAHCSLGGRSCGSLSSFACGCLARREQRGKFQRGAHAFVDPLRNRKTKLDVCAFRCNSCSNPG